MENDVEFASQPARWPRWPILPLKRCSSELPAHQEGFIVAVEGRMARVYFENVFRLQSGVPLLPQLDKIEFKEYESISAIFDDGWQVD